MILPIGFLIASLLTVAALPSSDSAKTFFEPGSQMPSKEELSRCVDQAAELLSIRMNAETDPALLNDILENDMHLADSFDVRRLLNVELKQAQPLGPMLNQVREGITTVHPSVGATLCEALANKETVGIFAAPNVAIVKRTIHHMFLLDKIVAEMANNKAFMNKIHKHVQQTVRSISPHKSSIGHTYDLFKAAGIFGVVKSYTIDGAMNDYENFREQGFVTPKEAEERKQGLTLNVLEATTTDLFHGYFDNARVGNTLAWWHPKSIEVVGENRTIAYVNDMNYARLYETWNLAFITGNLEFHNLLYPKLLIPTVVLADANSYLYKRVLALWISINFYLMAHLTGKAHVNIPDKGKLAKLFGKVNLRYSNYISSESTSESSS